MSNIITYSTVNKRKNNEDCCLAFEVMPQPNVVNNGCVLLLADGMGGHAHGEVYSRSVVLNMAQLLTLQLVSPSINPPKNSAENTSDFDEERIFAAMEETNTRVRKIMMANKWNGGESTLAAAVIIWNRLFFGSLGDSMIYHWSSKNKKLNPLSEDHSVTGIYLKNGDISLEEQQTHPQRHLLYYFMGIEQIPSKEESNSTGNAALDDGDMVLLCSDGISGDLTTVEMEHIFKLHESDCRDLIRELIVQARLAGQTDNQSLVFYRHFSENETNQRSNFEFSEKEIEKALTEKTGVKKNSNS